MTPEPTYSTRGPRVTRSPDATNQQTTTTRKKSVYSFTGPERYTQQHVTHNALLVSTSVSRLLHNNVGLSKQHICDDKKWVGLPILYMYTHI